VPRLLLEHQGALGLSDREAMVLIQLESLRWGPEAVVRPRHRVLATRLGKSVKRVEDVLRELRRRGLIETRADRRDRDHRAQDANVYTADGLRSLLDLIACNLKAGRDADTGLHAARVALEQREGGHNQFELPA